MSAWFYILRLKSGGLYIGATTDLDQRYKDHCCGKACRTTKLDLSGGILRREVSGNQHRYQLDPLCPINSEIKGIITKTVGIFEVVKQAFRSVKQKIERAFIYGSFASGDYGNDSDVDLLIVTELSGVKLAELLGAVQSEIGRSINISQFTSEEFSQRIEQNDHFLTRVLEGPKISIFGQ